MLARSSFAPFCSARGHVHVEKHHPKKFIDRGQKMTTVNK